MTSKAGGPFRRVLADLEISHAKLGGVGKNSGVDLEEFCLKFFGVVPGLSQHASNVLDDVGSQELDMVMFNDQTRGGLSFLGKILLLEAKNWKVPAGAAEVAWFDWKVRLSGYQDGFFIASGGVTGRQEDRTAAWSIIRQASAEGRRLFVLTPDELILSARTNSFNYLIKQKMLNLAVGRDLFE